MNPQTADTAPYHGDRTPEVCPKIPDNATAAEPLREPPDPVEQWAAWLASVGGPAAVENWSPPPFEPDLSESVWLAVGCPYLEDPGIGGTPAAAVRDANRCNVRTYADPELAEDMEGPPEDGTQIDDLMWRADPDAPNPCALVKVQGSPEAIEGLVRALCGGRLERVDHLVQAILRTAEEAALDRHEAALHDLVRLARRPFRDLLAGRLDSAGTTPAGFARLLEVPEATVTGWLGGAHPERRILPRLLGGLGTLARTA
jgi:hypothetical protein